MADFRNVIHALIQVEEMDRRLGAAITATRDANRELGDALRFYRHHNGISLRAVAAHLKLSAPFLSDCELGRRTLSDKYRKQYLNFIKPSFHHAQNHPERHITRRCLPRSQDLAKQCRP